MLHIYVCVCVAYFAGWIELPNIPSDDNDVYN